MLCSLRSRSPWRLIGAALTAALLACAPSNRAQTLEELERVVDESSRRHLETFESEEALEQYVEDLRRARQAHASSPAPWSDLSGSSADETAFASDSEGITVYDFADDDIDGELLEPSGALVTNRSLTNTQEAAVDEGGIVKAIGPYLVILRRGRLFSVDVSGRRARAVDSIDVSPAPDHFAWYDELLVTGSLALVVGYSYDSGGSELLRFRLDARGHWQRVDGWVVRSNDYYSSRNYASRLIGDRLVMYMQAGLEGRRGRVTLPEVARWKGGRMRRADWTEVMAATDVFRPVHPTTWPMLHVVIQCELGDPELRCEAQGFVGPRSRSFYVSSDAIYVWLHEWTPDAGAEPDATVHRLAFDGSDPGALRTWGMPTDQFSFKERDGMLAVLVSSTGEGDEMWGPERALKGDLSLMRVPVGAFSRGVVDVELAAFVDLPRPGDGRRAMVNRFVGDHLLYGEGDAWGWDEARRPAMLRAVSYTEPQPRVQSITLPHAVERIEALGRDAMVIGGEGRDLYFSSIELGSDLRQAAQYVERGAAQGETRSHGFFFSPRGRKRGLVGLPVRAGEQPGWAHLIEGSEGVVYLDVDDLALSPLGVLQGDPRLRDVDDRCTHSCVDWYGNARPLFIDDRVFALLGYELVEGRVVRGRVEEVDRTNLLSVVDGVTPPVRP